MKKRFFCISLIFLGLFACKKGSAVDSGASESGKAVTKAGDTVKKTANVVTRTKSSDAVSFSGRIIDLFDGYIVVKKGNTERRYYYNDDSKFYNLQGDLITKDDLWINHIVKISGKKTGAKNYIVSLQIISELSL